MTGYSLPRSRNCAAVVPATLVWIVLATLCDRHAEHRRLRTIDADGDLRTAFLAAEAHVGDPGRVFHHVARVLRETPGVVEVVAADFELQAAGRLGCCRRR